MAPTPMEDFLFDLNGFLILKNAVDPEMMRSLIAGADALPEIPFGGWHGHIWHLDIKGVCQYQNIIEAGAPFEALIDWPGWMAHIKRYVDPDGLYIDENFILFTPQGDGSKMHSGAHKRRMRTQFRYHDGVFHCGQVNILLPLTDIGPGDGATMVVPGSHKSNLIHPQLAARDDYEQKTLEHVTGAIEVHLKLGDALLFVDCLMHGSATRTNPGTRRMLVYRYGPHWGNHRFGCQPSDELLARLTPERRKIIQPIRPRRPPRA